MFESCVEIRSYFSDYRDGVCDRERVRSLNYHLEYCAPCRGELERFELMQSDLQALPRRRLPPDLALRLRVRMSQELHRNFLGRLWVRLENSLQPLLLPASGGVLTAVICFGLIMGSHAVPVTTSPDVPISLVTPARLRELAPINFTKDDQAVVLVTKLDSGGRVQSYEVLSGQQSPEMLRHLDRTIYFSIFDPATTFGKPTDGQVVLSLRRITVRG
ncbi:MAG TPA: zf-HC2 domain-containing protein [Terriglobia bacterium]|nr:zf-HC2 domain-containing protein [Terriglobia bacterium]